MRVQKRVKKGQRDGCRVERVVTLTEDETGFKIHGKANVTYDRIHFANGAVWTRLTDKIAEERGEAAFADDALHGAPDDAVEPAPMCGFLCGGSKKKSEEAQAAPPEEEVPAPPPKDLSEGFFGEEEVESIIDRINDVVGVWGISEEKERTFIKPPVILMNKKIKVAMETFLNNPLIELFQYLCDQSLEVKHKAKMIGAYMHKNFIEPLQARLMEMLTEQFSAIEWMHDQVEKVVSMMSHMVADELMTKSIEQLNDAEVADVQDDGCEQDDQ